MVRHAIVPTMTHDYLQYRARINDINCDFPEVQ